MKLIDRENGSGDGSLAASPQVVAALEAYDEALRCGRPIDRAQFLREHGEIADQLRDCLDALELIETFSGVASLEAGSEKKQSPLAPGDILGDFRILHEVGRGGMGVVYAAEQLGLAQRRVALKVVLGAASLDARTLQRFRVETQAAACLNHPNIVPVFAVGCERGTPYYAMPLINGHSLAAILASQRARRRKSIPAPDCLLPEAILSAPWPRVVARLGLQAAEALEHAHSLGIIHRDIKPSNLIVEASGRLWVTDFGLARITRDERDLTRTGDLVGTLRYLSPEQVSGEPGAGDARGDIYALGVTLYEAATLGRLFESCGRAALLHRIVHDEPIRPRAIDPALPKDLETIILKAIDKVPGGRYASVIEFAGDLRRFLDDQPVHARRLNLFEHAVRWSKKQRAIIAIAVAGVVLCMGVATVTLWRAKQDAEANLVKIRAARSQERAAFEGAFHIHEAITLPLIEEAVASGVWETERRNIAYQQMISFYERVAHMFAPDEHQLEVVAMAARRAGALRMAIADSSGRSDYVRAIELYEALAKNTPKALWYRTNLISTLREYSRLAEESGDGETANACRRRVYEIAHGLVGDSLATAHCFRPKVIVEFEAIIEMLSEGRDAAVAPLADQLARWLKENRQ